MRLLLTILLFFGAATFCAENSLAEEKPSESPSILSPVIVTGEDLRYKTHARTEVTSDAAALPAPTTILNSRYLEQTPVTTYGDVFRGLPGIDVSNFGQGGIGYGIAMRGFTDAEHGRDVAYFIDGVPLNEVSSVHTPNYADLNILIPETVERVEIIRGPFSALYGDSNLGGAVNIITKRYQPYASLGASGGSFTTSRGIATYGQAREDAGSLRPFLAYEGYNTDGYRNNQGFKHYDLFNKVTLPTKEGALSLRAQFYGADWGAPGYLSRNLVQSGALSPKAAVNSSDGGNKDLQNVVLNYDLGAPDQAFTATGFISHDIFNRFADFGSGQRLQDENRTTYGLTLQKAWTDRLFGALPAQLLIGLNWRDDSVHVHQYPTLNRMPNGAPVKDLDFNENGLGEYVQGQIKPWSWLKVTAGGRYDHFWYDIDDHLATTSVPKSDTGVLSPKAGLAIAPASWLEIFANYGEGFRSPSAADDLPTSPNVKPMKLRSQEIGFTVDPTARVHFLADVWSTTINNEIFQPAPGLPVQNLGRSRREGYDLEGRYYLYRERLRELSLFVNYTQIRAVLRDQGAATYVPNVPAYIVNVGTDFNVPVGGENSPHRFLGSVSAQLVGKKHLTEDGVITTSPYERFVARFGYSYRNQWMAFIDAIWYPTDRLSETAFNFGNVVSASPSDIVVGPQAPVTLLVGLSYRFKTS